MVTQQVKKADRAEDGTWSQGKEITIVPAQVCSVDEVDGHAIIQLSGGSKFFIWPDKAAVDLFLQNA